MRPELLHELLEELATLVVERLHERLEPGSGDAASVSRWLSIESAAAYLEWPKQRLYKLTAAGEIPHYKHEGRLLFRRDELDRWLRQYAQGRREGGDWL